MWFFIALVVGAGLASLFFWFRNKGISTTWYDWVLGIIAVFLVMFMIQNYFGSLNEFKSTAANWFLLVAGLPALVILAVVWQLIVRRNRA
jgi:hypothetical protein